MNHQTDQSIFFRDGVLKLSQQHSLCQLSNALLEFIEQLNVIDTAVIYEIHHQNVRLKDNPKGQDKQEIYYYSSKDNYFNEISESEYSSISNIISIPHASFIANTKEWAYKFNLQKNIIQVLYIKWNKESVQELENVNALATLYENLSKLIELTEHDTLTGLLNRKSLNEHLAKAINACSKQSLDKPEKQSSTLLAILDIDHFKKINDNYGHLYGDEILLLFSQIMKKCFRHEDLLFRFGGEEFLIILNHANHHGAVGALERFRHSIENYSFPNDKQITVSIGYVKIKAGILPSSLLDEADYALYEAKDNGRNQIVEFISKEKVSTSELELFTHKNS